MDFLGGLLGRQKKVTNQKLSDDISKLCEELATGIIELSDKAKKINELKEKYKNSQSELENSSTNPGSVIAKPASSKGFLSTVFGSEENEAPPPPPPPPPSNQPPLDVNSPEAVDNIEPESLSTASIAPLPSSEKSIEPMGALEGIYNPGVSTGDIPPSSDISPLETLPAPKYSIDDDRDDSSTTIGGKNRKKSKRSKKTIRKTDKKSNRVTKKQKVNNADEKARAQGLAQARLQGQGQSLV